LEDHTHTHTHTHTQGGWGVCNLFEKEEKRGRMSNTLEATSNNGGRERGAVGKRAQEGGRGASIIRSCG